MHPPYPALLTVAGTGWRSPLAHNGAVPLDRSVVHIGRMETNDLILVDPLASRHHAVIRWAPTGYEVDDLGSANGTFVSGQRVVGRAPLSPGDVVRIGTTEMLFRVRNGSEQNQTLAHGLSAFAGAPGASALPGAWPGQDNSPTVGRFPAPPPGQPAPYPPPGAYDRLPPVAYGQPPAPPPTRSGLMQRVRDQLRKRYWRVFLLGFGAYLVSAVVLATTGILNLVPLVLLLASAVVPVTFVLFCWEQNAFADMPAAVVGLTFLSGAVFGLTLAAVLEPVLIPPLAAGKIGLGAAIGIALCEETAKIVAVLWYLRDRRLRSELDGLILGAAAGMGFAALETAGYGFQAFLAGYTDAFANGLPGQAIAVGIATMNGELLIRMALAIFGHGIWTAIACAAIWRERGTSSFRLTGGVTLAFAIAVTLHALWDWGPASLLWYLPVGLLGIFILRFFIRESLDREKVGPGAPPPAPLSAALRAYLAHPFASQRTEAVAFTSRPGEQRWQP